MNTSAVTAHAAETPAPPLKLVGESGVYWWQYDWLQAAVDGGVVAGLKGAEVKVLVALLRHANRDGEAFPSIPTIEAETGLKKRTVQQSLSSLSTPSSHSGVGIIDRMPDGHRNRRTVTYRFATSMRADQVHPVEGPAAGQSRPDQDGCFTRSTRTQPRGSRTTVRTTRTGMRSNYQREQSKELVVDRGDDDEFRDDLPEGAGLFDAHEAVQMLLDIGFNPRDARKQVQRHGIDSVRESVAKAVYFKQHGIKVNGQTIENVRGFVAKDLAQGMPQDDRVEQARKKRAAIRSAEAARQHQIEQEAAERRAQEADSAMVRMVIETMSADKLEVYRQRALGKMQEWLRSRYAARPATDRMLAHAVFEEIMADPHHNEGGAP